MASREAEQQGALETPEVPTLDALFNRAKAKDEFEYVCALLRIKGLESPAWDPLEESRRAINDYTRISDFNLGDNGVEDMRCLWRQNLGENVFTQTTPAR